VERKNINEKEDEKKTDVAKATKEGGREGERRSACALK
jgi:hypothetical protein